MYCSKCGMKIDVDDAFCKGCGARQSTSESHGRSSGSSADSVITKIAAAYALRKAANAAMDSIGIGIPNRNPDAE